MERAENENSNDVCRVSPEPTEEELEAKRREEALKIREEQRLAKKQKVT